MREEATVRDVMTQEFVGVSESDQVLETVELLVEEAERSAVVLRGADPVGLLTAGTVLESLADGDDPRETVVSDVMRVDPPTVAPDHTVGEAADTMSAVGGRSLLVLEDGSPAGLLTERDLLAASRLSANTDTPPGPEPTVQTSPVGDVQAEGSSGDEAAAYSAQGICEACGALTRELADVNGQLLCIDCRDV